MPQDRSPQVVIIGAGLAGLACAVKLSEAGITTQVLEATDRVGGRLRSDIVDGFTLDHGFHALPTAYPGCRQLLDYPALRLRAFEPGMMVRHRGRFVTVSAPGWRPWQWLQTATAGLGTWGDQWRLAQLRRAAHRGTLEQLYQREHQPSGDRLRQLGFTEPFIEAFFRPLLGSLILDPGLETSSRMLEFAWRMWTAGDVALPADGIAAIPRQLAERLPRGTLRLAQSVLAIDDREVHLSSGEVLTPATIVVATENVAAARIVGVPQLETPWRQCVTHYFAANASPNRRRMVLLAGDEFAPAAAADHAAEPTTASQPNLITSVVVPSDIAPEYAPPGRALICVRTTEPATHDVSATGPPRVQAQLQRWFGPAVQSWRHLRSYAIPYALPVQSLRDLTPPLAHGNIVLCGDYCETPSMQGAINSGLRAAEIARTL